MHLSKVSSYLNKVIKLPPSCIHSHVNNALLYVSRVTPGIYSNNFCNVITKSVCRSMTTSIEDRESLKSLNVEHLRQCLQSENKQLNQLLKDYKDHLFKDLARREETADGSNLDYEDGIKEYEEWAINSRKETIAHIKDELAKKGVITVSDSHIRELEDDIYRLRTCLGMRDGERQRWLLIINKHTEKEKDLRIAFWCSTLISIFVLTVVYYMYPDSKDKKENT